MVAHRVFAMTTVTRRGQTAGDRALSRNTSDDDDVAHSLSLESMETSWSLDGFFVGA
jgi:hypothetical protein